MNTTAHRARAAARGRQPAPAAGHIALVTVCAGYCLLVWLRTPQSMSLTFDEVVYASQLSVDTPAAEFAAHRARGTPLLLAPVVTVTEWVVALRVYLTLLSGVLMYVAFQPWLVVFVRPGGPFRYVPAVAAGCLATLWPALLFATMAYPNLPLAFLLVAAVGWFHRAVVEPAPAWRPVAGVAAAFAVVPRWRRPWPPAAVVVGLLTGWGAWVGEAFARFDGPVQRLRASAASTGGSLVNSLPANLDAVDGPELLCRPATDCAGVDPAAASWWVLLPVLVTAGLAVAARTRWLGAGALATASAVSFAAPYLVLLDFTSPRFLLPAYALLAIPVAGLLVRVTGLGGRTTRAVTTGVAASTLLLHAVTQQGVLGTVATSTEATYASNARQARYLREQHDVKPPCLVWGTDAIPLNYLLKCRSLWEPHGDPPRRDDPAIAAARGRGDAVVVRIPADREPPRFMTRWRQVQPGSSTYATYLPPVNR